MSDKRSIELIISLGSEGWDRLREAITRFADTLGDTEVAATDAADAMSRLSFRARGLSTIEIDPNDAIAALNAKAKAHAQPTACHRCLYHSGNPLLACAVHPTGRPGEVCGDWEELRFSAEATSLSFESALTPEEAETLIKAHGLEVAQFVAERRNEGMSLAAAMAASTPLRRSLRHPTN